MYFYIIILNDSNYFFRMAEKVKACIQVITNWIKLLYGEIFFFSSKLLQFECIFLFFQKASKYLDENSRFEMLDVLTHLEGELQAKDVTIAALKVIPIQKGKAYNHKNNIWYSIANLIYYN